MVKCVQSLAAQSIADRCEILIVDNHSEDDSIGIIRNRFGHLPQVKIIENRENAGYGKGNRLGVEHATGEFLLIINPDNELQHEALESMVSAMEADSSIGILSPKLTQEDGSVRDSFRTFPDLSDVVIKRTALRRLFPGRLRRYLQHDQDPNATRDVDWVVGACFLMRKDFYVELGGLDPRFFLFFEDIDLCRRCWMAGKRVVYFPQAEATDRKKRLSEGGIFKLLFKKTGRIHVQSALKYFWKWQGKPLPRLSH